MNWATLEWTFWGVFAAASLAAWAAGIVRLRNGRPLLPLDKGQEATADWPWQLEEVCFGFAAFLLVPALVVSLLSGWVEERLYLLAIAAQLATVLSVFALLLLRHRQMLVLPRQVSFGGSLRVGLLAFVMWVPIVLLIQTVLIRWFPYQHSTLELLETADSESWFARLFTAWTMAVLCAPIAEELMFRGLLQGWLQRVLRFNFLRRNGFASGQPSSGTRVSPASDSAERANRASARGVQGGANSLDFGHGAPGSGTSPVTPSRPHSPPLGASVSARGGVAKPEERSSESGRAVAGASAIVVASLVFAMMHWNQFPAPIPLFVLSLGIGYVFYRTGSLLSCIVIHMLLNGLTMALVTARLLWNT